MQYIYTECQLPSNGKIYPTQTVHLRPKTIFEIKLLLNTPYFNLKSEVDALQNCIDPNDNINVYDLVNQDVVYLLYKLRSLSDDNLIVEVANKQHNVNISDLNVKYLDEWDNKRTLPESNIKVELAYKPLSMVYNFDKLKNNFIKKYPEYKGDIENAVQLICSIDNFDGNVNKDHIRANLEKLSWKDSIYLINEIEKFNKQDFGIQEEITLDINGESVTIPLKITESFFRAAL